MLFVMVWGLVIAPDGTAQHPVPEKNRFRFAQGAIGVRLFATAAGQSSFVDEAGLVNPYTFGQQVYPMLHLGGMHFWGRVEFFFSIALGQLGTNKITSGKYLHLSQNDLFGFKYYPWRLTRNALRPFFGGAIGGLNYQQKDDLPSRSGVLRSQFVLPFLAGFSLMTGKSIWDLSVRYLATDPFHYYISPDKATRVTTPSVWLGLTYKRVIEGTAGSEAYYYSGKEDADYRKLKAEKKLNALFLAAGPSAALFTHALPFNAANRPYLDRYVSSNAFADAGIGYFFERARGFLGVAFRGYQARRAAFGTKQVIRRRSVLFEINRYLLDYQGFVPYVGAGISYEQIHFSESLPDSQNSSRHIHWAWGITVGWDILPTRLEYFTLRTNVRYFPGLHLNLDASKVTMPQLEVNIIQAVFYPQRFKHVRNL